MAGSEIKDGKLWATISYITPIGLLIAISMNLEKKNPYVFFHARQMIGLIILVIFSNICEKYVNSWFGTALWFITFIGWLYSLFFAIKGEYKLLPFLGHYFQDWFKNLK
ncbi:hypothetical protein [Winogradskyella sp. R77965]|uniref:hypothetical protein n=1 Tax=Winogradskyella sp. R77965 TaxID=3093872 RepID=UPI0037DC4B9C